MALHGELKHTTTPYIELKKRGDVRKYIAENGVVKAYELFLSHPRYGVRKALAKFLLADYFDDLGKNIEHLEGLGMNTQRSGILGIVKPLTEILGSRESKAILDTYSPEAAAPLLADHQTTVIIRIKKAIAAYSKTTPLDDIKSALDELCSALIDLKGLQPESELYLQTRTALIRTSHELIQVINARAVAIAEEKSWVSELRETIGVSINLSQTAKTQIAAHEALSLHVFLRTLQGLVDLGEVTKADQLMSHMSRDEIFAILKDSQKHPQLKESGRLLAHFLLRHHLDGFTNESMIFLLKTMDLEQAYEFLTDLENGLTQEDRLKIAKAIMAIPDFAANLPAADLLDIVQIIGIEPFSQMRIELKIAAEKYRAKWAEDKELPSKIVCINILKQLAAQANAVVLANRPIPLSRAQSEEKDTTVAELLLKFSRLPLYKRLFFNHYLYRMGEYKAHLTVAEHRYINSELLIAYITAIQKNRVKFNQKTATYFHLSGEQFKKLFENSDRDSVLKAIMAVEVTKLGRDSAQAYCPILLSLLPTEIDSTFSLAELEIIQNKINEIISNPDAFRGDTLDIIQFKKFFGITISDTDDPKLKRLSTKGYLALSTLATIRDSKDSPHKQQIETQFAERILADVKSGKDSSSYIELTLDPTHGYKAIALILKSGITYTSEQAVNEKINRFVEKLIGPLAELKDPLDKNQRANLIKIYKFDQRLEPVYKSWKLNDYLAHLNGEQSVANLVRWHILTRNDLWAEADKLEFAARLDVTSLSVDQIKRLTPDVRNHLLHNMPQEQLRIIGSEKLQALIYDLTKEHVTALLAITEDGLAQHKHKKSTLTILFGKYPKEVLKYLGNCNRDDKYDIVVALLEELDLGCWKGQLKEYSTALIRAYLYAVSTELTDKQLAALTANTIVGRHMADEWVWLCANANAKGFELAFSHPLVLQQIGAEAPKKLSMGFKEAIKRKMSLRQILNAVTSLENSGNVAAANQLLFQLPTFVGIYNAHAISKLLPKDENIAALELMSKYLQRQIDANNLLKFLTMSVSNQLTMAITTAVLTGLATMPHLLANPLLSKPVILAIENQIRGSDISTFEKKQQLRQDLRALMLKNPDIGKKIIHEMQRFNTINFLPKAHQTVALDVLEPYITADRWDQRINKSNIFSAIIWSVAHFVLRAASLFVWPTFIGYRANLKKQTKEFKKEQAVQQKLQEEIAKNNREVKSQIQGAGLNVTQMNLIAEMQKRCGRPAILTQFLEDYCGTPADSSKMRSIIMATYNSTFVTEDMEGIILKSPKLRKAWRECWQQEKDLLSKKSGNSDLPPAHRFLQFKITKMIFLKTRNGTRINPIDEFKHFLYDNDAAIGRDIACALPRIHVLDPTVTKQFAQLSKPLCVWDQHPSDCYAYRQTCLAKIAECEATIREHKDHILYSLAVKNATSDIAYYHSELQRMDEAFSIKPTSNREANSDTKKMTTAKTMVRFAADSSIPKEVKQPASRPLDNKQSSAAAPGMPRVAPHHKRSATAVPHKHRIPATQQQHSKDDSAVPKKNAKNPYPRHLNPFISPAGAQAEVVSMPLRKRS